MSRKVPQRKKMALGVRKALRIQLLLHRNDENNKRQTIKLLCPSLVSQQPARRSFSSTLSIISRGTNQIVGTPYCRYDRLSRLVLFG